MGYLNKCWPIVLQRKKKLYLLQKMSQMFLYQNKKQYICSPKIEQGKSY